MPSFPVDVLDRKELGNTGEKVPAIGIGTYGIVDYGRAKEALIHAVEVGLNMLDTAEMYGSGKAEMLVGEVVKEVGRDNVFITTKLLPHHFSDKFEAIKAAKQSLRRLNISEADLILIHWPHIPTPIEKQVKALEAIASEGLTRYIGVSNFNS